MTDSWNVTLPQSAWSNFKEISISDDWFKVYEIAANLFVFYEPRHYEQTLVNLIIGRERAALIDTGCGIGDLRKAVKAVTDKPVVVINTHTHPDHLGSNYQFGDVAMFDHPLAHRVAENGRDARLLLSRRRLWNGWGSRYHARTAWSAARSPIRLHVLRTTTIDWCAPHPSSLNCTNF
jgi:glyoxylase-like metal-dependent hydrolase (beta-lactamase superfamily II)